MYSPLLLYTAIPVTAALVLGIGQRLHEHPAGEGVVGMRAEIAGPLAEVGDGPGQRRLRRIGRDVEDVDLAVREAARPEEAPIVGEAHVVASLRDPIETELITLP
jgi:hypothetical protein